MYEITGIVCFFAALYFVIEHIMDNSPTAESLGMEDECVMCNKGTCKGCPVSARIQSLSKGRQEG